VLFARRGRLCEKNARTKEGEREREKRERKERKREKESEYVEAREKSFTSSAAARFPLQAARERRL